MITKINKALDFNKLLADQAQGRLLKKHLDFPLYAGVKLDGNYSVVIKEAEGLITYLTSGGHEYTPNGMTTFQLASVPPMAYFVERIGTDGKLGDRVRCSLKGSVGAKVAHGHTYLVHDAVPIADYNIGRTMKSYFERRQWMEEHLPYGLVIEDVLVHDRDQLDLLLAHYVRKGYEGLMLKSPDWRWKHTKSRNIELAKYKKRPTADLLCIGLTEGEGKYVGMIGALILQDSEDRIVSVGSGLDDWDRQQNDDHFKGKVIEIAYEQIIETYIQPTFISRRLDKLPTDLT